MSVAITVEAEEKLIPGTHHHYPICTAARDCELEIEASDWIIPFIVPRLNSTLQHPDILKNRNAIPARRRSQYSREYVDSAQALQAMEPMLKGC